MIYLFMSIVANYVSLPGVGDNEQPTILEVLNRGIVDTKEEPQTGTDSTNKGEDEDLSHSHSTTKVTSKLEEEELKKDPLKTAENDTESDILVIRNSSSGSQSKWNEPQQRSQLNEDEENYVYDIESHLIETLKNYSVSEDSGTWGVDIKELPPAEGESFHRTSKIESDPLVGTVLEVEPASPKVLKPVETSVQEPQRQSVFAQKEPQPQIEIISSELEDISTKEGTNSEVAQNLNKNTKSFESEELITAQNTNEDLDIVPATENTKPVWTVVRELQGEYESNKISKNLDEEEPQTRLTPTEDYTFENLRLNSEENRTVIVTDLDSEELEDCSGLQDTGIDLSYLSGTEEEIRPVFTSSSVDINQNLNFSDHNNDEESTSTLSSKSNHIDTNSNLEEQSIHLERPKLSSTPAEDSNTQLTDTTNIKIEPTAPDPVSIESSSSEAPPIEKETAKTEDSASLTQEIDQKLSELSTHLTTSSKVDLNGNISKSEKDKLFKEPVKEGFDINGLPLPRTAAEEEQRKEFLDSLPQVSLETDSNKVAALAKREYYQSLRQYLITHVDRPPVPPETYRWEDLKRAKQRGGYPWTHLHKRPLGPDEEPEIVLLLRKSQELRFASESPKSFKKVRIDDQVSIKETERYIQELSDTEQNSQTEDEEEDEDEHEHEDERSECISCVSDSVLTVEKKASKLGKLRGILKKRSPKKEVDSRSLPDTSVAAPSTSFTSNHKSEDDVRERQSRPTKEDHHHKAKCFPIMKKLKSMADRQKKNFKNIKKISLKKEEKIPLDEEQKIIKLKTSPKAVHSEIPHFIEKQDSDDVLEIIELDESPSRKRKDQLELQEQASAESTVLVPDEIIDIPTTIEDDISDRQQTPEPTVSEILEEEMRSSPVFSGPPKKAARLRREHVYEDIEDTGDSVSEEINTILQMASVEALKHSLAKQDHSTLKDVEATNTSLSIEHMGSSEEEVERATHFLAPLSSIDSGSSAEEERKPHLSPVSEESDAASHDGIVVVEKEVENKLQVVPEVAKERNEHLPWTDIELKPVLKKEASPAPSEKKVTFSHVEDEAEPHREDIELPEELRGTGPKRWSQLRINPIESRPTSKQGFLSDMEHHGDQNVHHFDNISTRSFNMMGRSTEFDRMSTAGSFGGRGLVVRSISNADEPEMVGGMMAGHRGRQMSIGGMSGGSYGGRDPDAVSIRSGISLRRVSRSPSHADLFVADLNIPVGHVSRGIRRDVPRHITNLPSSSPVSGKISSPEFSKYDRNNVPLPTIQTRHVTGENKENVSGHTGNTLPQNKPIDVSMYEDRHEAGKSFGQRIEIPQLNLVAPTPTPTMANTASPDFGRRKLSPKGHKQSHRLEDNIMPHTSGYSGSALPQNQPINVSMYEEGGGEPMEISNLYASMHGQSIYDRKTVHPHQMSQENKTLHHESTLPQNMSIDVSMYEDHSTGRNIESNRTLNTSVVGPPPSTPGFGRRSPPNADIYDRQNQSTSGVQPSWSQEQQGNILPQNKPIDVSMYEDNAPRVNSEPNGTPKMNMSTHSPPRPPGFGVRSPPNVDIYDRKSQGPSGVSHNQSRQEPQLGNILPQHKPIDVSMYEERVPGRDTANQPMDVDIEAIEAVVEVRDTIRIDRMSPPLQLNVPDLSPKVENETRIEIRNFAPQPDMRPLDEILKDDKQIGHSDQFQDPSSRSHGQSPPPPSQQTQLKRQHGQGRAMSPDSSKKQLMERGLSPDRQSYPRGSSPGRQNMSSDEFRYRGPDSSKKQLMERGLSPDRQSYPRGSSPGRQNMNSDEFRYRGPDIYDQSVQRSSSPVPIRPAQSTNFSSEIFQRGSSPAPKTSMMEERHNMQYESNQTFDRGLSPPRTSQTSPRGSSPAPSPSGHLEDRQYGQYESAQTFNRGLSPPRTDTKQHLQRASPSFHAETRQLERDRSPVPQSSQRASSPVPMEIQQMEPRQLLQRGSPQGVSFKRHTEPTQTQTQRASSPVPVSGMHTFPRASSPATGTMKAGRILNFRRSLSMDRPKTSDKVLERKPTYSSRFMSMFHSKNTDPTGKPLNEKRRVSADHVQDIKRGRSTSRFMSVFHSKPSGDPLGQHPHEKRKLSADVIIHMNRGRSPSPGRQLKPDSSPSRFMSMFHSKAAPDQSLKSETPHHNNLELPTNNRLQVDRGRSPSPSPSLSPGKQPKPEGSPSSSRFMGAFKREKVERSEAMSVVEEPSHQANMSIQKPPEKPPLTVKVTETFSLKVDEMDQYTSHPPKSPSPVRQTHLYASSDQLGKTQESTHMPQDRFTRDGLSESIAFSVDPQEPFAPVVLSSSRSSQMHLVAGDRRNYMSASQADLSGSRRFDSHELIPPAPAQIITVGNKKLVSVPIAVPDFYDSEMSISEFMRDEHEKQRNISHPQLQRSNLIKAPSEQRLAQSRLLQRKTHERTQSQDRAAAERASELDSLSIGTRSKTVSFNFGGGHGSRLGQHEKMDSSSSNNQLDKKHWLERTYFSRDHEYEPIGEPSTEIKKESTPEPPALVSALKKESSPAPVAQEIPKLEVSQPSVDVIADEALSRSEELREAEELQKDIEDRYFSSAATTSQPEHENDYDMQASQVESSALELEDMPMEAESKKKGFMANAQDKTRRMQAGLKNQAGKIKTKFRAQKKAPSGSPKATNRKRFKAPEFSKIKMPEMKRPEFTKFSKPDMSKFKLPDKFSSLKLTRSKSFKEPTEVDDTTVSGTTPESGAATAPPKKQRFDFSFGTYPRAFKKKPKPQEVQESTVDEPSVIQSTETQPSAESSSTPQGDRGPGPVRSRWADKFSDVSYNDSEGSRYRRFESEQESSFDRESSMERRMKEVLDENEKEEAELAMLGVVEQKQFADYDEENRVIHEISKTREREFKRRPMVHQDSDLVSEEGRDIGWTRREAEKNQILRKAELEAESHAKYVPKREQTPETQSTASSKRFVFEEISSDEFLLRKKGASQEFSIGKQKYLDENLDKSGNDAEAAAGSQLDSLNGSSIDRIDYGYDVPPPKPRRLSHQQRQRHHYDSENASQIDDYGDDISLSQAGSDYFRHAPPSRPLRKGRFKNSQDMSVGGTPSIQYDDEDSVRNQNFVDEEKENIQHEHEHDHDHEEEQEKRNDSPIMQQPPQPPRRRRKQLRDSLEKDSYINGFGGRSVSNSYLREDNKPEEVIVYRTEHEYKIPLATPENYTDTSATPRKSKSLSRLGIDEDDRTSRGADSLALDLAMRGDNDDDDNLNAEELHEKYIIEMMENDGYAVVRKDNLPKPTPPARRKKFSRSPGERFATMPHQRKASPSMIPAEHKVSTGNYSTIGRPSPPRRKSALSLTADPQKDYGSQDFTDYEEPELDERPESPRNLQSGDIINKMKYRPLPPPPRPPREKRHRDRNGGDDTDEIESRDDRDDRDGGGERIAYDELHDQSSDDYNQQQNVEVEVSTQTDPLPDDFVCEEFEITEDMRIIEPRRTKTLDEILKEEEEAELERAKQIDEEILARGIQRFREASQRSASDRSRASSQAKSLSRPQTPSAILIEKRIPTPVPNSNGQTVLEASLTVQPIDDLDLEEELLRREGLYDGSHSKSDGESRHKDEEEHSARAVSEEENARVDEEVQSYTRSTDAESQQLEEEERELERQKELALEAERRLHIEEEKREREREEEEEENRRLQEEVEADERLLRELEEEQRFLEEALRRHAEEEKEFERRIQEEEEEEERKRIIEELQLEHRLNPDSMSEEHESYDEERNDRLKAEDSLEHKSEMSEEKETTPLPPSPTPSPLPQEVEEEVTVSQVKKLLLEQPPKEQSHEREATLSPPPMAPPRKRSTAEALSVTEQQPVPVPFTGVMPSHLTIADLEVERLRVHALQAGQIMVSHLHGAQIQAEELECRSGNLVVKNIELPPGFIEDIVERVRSTEREHAQAATQTIAEARTQTEEDSIPPPPIPTRQPEIPPVRPPPPSSAHFLQLRDHHDEVPGISHPTDYTLQTISPIGFYNHLHPDDDGELAAGPPPVYRRRRHHRRRDSSSEEEHQRRRSRSIRPEQPPPPQSVAQAGRQFISACSLPLVNVITQLTNALRPNNDNNKDQVQPRNISTAVVLLVVMALSFVIYLLTGRNIHHHHWDYFNPPGNDGRLS